MLTSRLDGEIDIAKSFNMQTANQMALYNPMCNMDTGLPQTGTPQSVDCGSLPTGCGVTEANPNSSGKAFADSGGGVWVTQFDASGISIWFVPVSDNASAPSSFI